MSKNSSGDNGLTKFFGANNELQKMCLPVIWQYIFTYLSNNDLINFIRVSKEAWNLVFILLYKEVIELSKKEKLSFEIYKKSDEKDSGDVLKKRPSLKELGYITLFYPTGVVLEEKEIVGLWNKWNNKKSRELYLEEEEAKNVAFEGRNKPKSVLTVKISYLTLRGSFDNKITNSVIYGGCLFPIVIKSNAKQEIIKNNPSLAIS